MYRDPHVHRQLSLRHEQHAPQLLTAHRDAAAACGTRGTRDTRNGFEVRGVG